MPLYPYAQAYGNGSPLRRQYYLAQFRQLGRRFLHGRENGDLDPSLPDDINRVDVPDFHAEHI
ncbi:hypothetical protein, partial [Thiolapillus sp.]|uniref:hypothetical protein n=1 Tax=Thiolapillus sp. TaxID=2017437 RepID=UPI003AF89EFB